MIADKTCGRWTLEFGKNEIVQIIYTTDDGEPGYVENNELQDLRDLRYLLAFAINQLEKKRE